MGKCYEMLSLSKQDVYKRQTLVVSSPDVAVPAAVRYAWDNYPEGCNLYNGDGLPAPPFRTDTW